LFALGEAAEKGLEPVSLECRINQLGTSIDSSLVFRFRIKHGIVTKNRKLVQLCDFFKCDSDVLFPSGCY